MGTVFVPLGRPFRPPRRRDRFTNAIGKNSAKHFSPKMRHIGLDEYCGTVAKEKGVSMVKEVNFVMLEGLKNLL